MGNFDTKSRFSNFNFANFREKNVVFANSRDKNDSLARQTGQEEGEAVRHLWGKLSLLLQRGNAAILANRVPAFPAPEVDGLH